MAEAGFIYMPQHPGDDGAMCLYCGTSLSGWDADDDPLCVVSQSQFDATNPRIAKNITNAVLNYRPPALSCSSRSPTDRPPSPRPARRRHHNWADPPRSKANRTRASPRVRPRAPRHARPRSPSTRMSWRARKSSMGRMTTTMAAAGGRTCGNRRARAPSRS